MYVSGARFERTTFCLCAAEFPVFLKQAHDTSLSTILAYFSTTVTPVRMRTSYMEVPCANNIGSLFAEEVSFREQCEFNHSTMCFLLLSDLQTFAASFARADR